MDWRDIGKALVSQGVPLLGGLLGGPAGAIAGKVVAGLFDADPGSPESVMNAIQQDPEAMRKLREFELTHQQKLQELQLEETKAFLADIDSARRREAAVVAATGKADRHLYVLAYIMTGTFLLLAGYLFHGAIYGGSSVVAALKDNSLVMLIIGALISGFTQVLSYFFGSSQGSAEKTKVMSARG
ncbi:MAG: hypothetical protein A4E57_02238 [Syntrophorhabdaceae bacterium PtaU1.Bin034]|nr:MAG: hypothetical protein A4E57_02238 [Syntrophorhabdaceae bacterium PtaU1.Bin034]